MGCINIVFASNEKCVCAGRWNCCGHNENAIFKEAVFRSPYAPPKKLVLFIFGEDDVERSFLSRLWGVEEWFVLEGAVR